MERPSAGEQVHSKEVCDGCLLIFHTPDAVTLGRALSSIYTAPPVYLLVLHPEPSTCSIAGRMQTSWELVATVSCKVSRGRIAFPNPASVSPLPLQCHWASTQSNGQGGWGHTTAPQSTAAAIQGCEDHQLKVVILREALSFLYAKGRSIITCVTLQAQAMCIKWVSACREMSPQTQED